MARKVNKNLIALSSAAVVAVYAAGYAHTQPAAGLATASVARPASGTVVRIAPSPAPSAPAPAASSMPSASPSASPMVPPSAATSAATAIARAIATATAVSQQAPPSTASAAYIDGTYSGAGSNRFGEVDVSVTVQGGRIVNAQITRATTYYPVSRIARLPGQVTDRQSAQVDMVSGATNSSRAFRDAVAQALAQAGGTGGPASPVAPTAPAARGPRGFGG